jgi:hypothetical protein
MYLPTSPNASQNLPDAGSFSSSFQNLLFVPLALALNIIIDAAIIFAGSRVNPDTRNVI